MSSNTFILVTLPGCRPCVAMKQHLDRLAFEDDIQNDFSYSVVDATRAYDLVKQHDIQSAPTFISPRGNKLTGNPGKDRLREWIRSEIQAISEER